MLMLKHLFSETCPEQILGALVFKKWIVTSLIISYESVEPEWNSLRYRYVRTESSYFLILFWNLQE
jgi:hypothetical protein